MTLGYPPAAARYAIPLTVRSRPRQWASDVVLFTGTGIIASQYLRYLSGASGMVEGLLENRTLTNSMGTTVL